jgi:hypothetical protein
MPNITALFATDFPTGRFRNLNPSHLGVDAMGGGAYVFTGGLNMSKYLKPFIFYGNIWYSCKPPILMMNGGCIPGISSP